MKKLITIPFTGFYETIHGSKIDDHLEYYTESLSIEQAQDIFENVKIDFKRFKHDYSESYVKAFCSEYDLLKGLEFESVESPKFYNYSTDRIFCNITPELIEFLWNQIDLKTFDEIVKARFTSRDGFASFYSNDFEEWGPIENWDHNQLGALLEAYCFDYDQLDPARDHLDDIYDIEIDSLEYVDSETLEKIDALHGEG